MKSSATFFLLGSALLLSACGGTGASVRDTLGLSKKAPDEFRVVSRPPLSVPPEFNLRPPAEGGETAAAGVATRDEARQMVLGSQPGSGLSAGSADTAVMPVSSNELATGADAQFLQNAGAGGADSSIRQKLAADAPQDDKTVLQKLREPGNNEPLVDADKEKERLDENKQAGKSVSDGETPTVKGKDTGPLGRILGY